MRIDAIAWSAEVEEKLAGKHQLSIDEVGEVVFEPEAGEITMRRGREGTYYVYGQTAAGRYLWVCLAPMQGELNAWTLVTARDMTESERKSYQEWVGE